MPTPFQLAKDYLDSESSFTGEGHFQLDIDHGVRGWIGEEVADAILHYRAMLAQRMGKVVKLSTGANDFVSRSQALQTLSRQLADLGLVKGWRGEPMRLFSNAGKPFADLERAAFRTLGLPTRGVHLNALVAGIDGASMWTARRSPDKAVDPGKLDNLVGGGVIGNEPVHAALRRECWEEAGLELNRPLHPRGILHVCRLSEHGVQIETLYIHDLWLAPCFRPHPMDGEVVGNCLMSVKDTLTALHEHEFTRDAGLVVLDGLCRQWYFGADSPVLYRMVHDFSSPRA